MPGVSEEWPGSQCAQIKEWGKDLTKHLRKQWEVAKGWVKNEGRTSRTSLQISCGECRKKRGVKNDTKVFHLINLEGWSCHSLKWGSYWD